MAYFVHIKEATDIIATSLVVLSSAFCDIRVHITCT